jgi:hypothetical protein
MTLRDISRETVLDALRGASAGSILDRCRHAVAKDQRDSFTVTASPAEALRKTLEVKHRIARTNGKVLEGGDDLLLALRELGETPVTGVFVDEGPVHYMVYLRAWTLEPVSGVIMEDPQSA